MKTVFFVRLLPGLLAAAGLFAGHHAQAQAPANDDCAGAIALPVAASGGSCPGFSATNLGATDSQDVPPPGCAASYQGGDVWYVLTVPPSGNLQISSAAAPGSPVEDTQLTLYSGSCGSLVEIGCSEDIDWNNYFSRITVGGQPAGQQLYLRAATYANATQGAFELCARELPPCGAPTAVRVGNISATKATISFTPNILASNYTITYTAQGGTSQAVSTSNTAETLNGLLPATTYTVAVASDCGSTQPGSAPITFRTAPPPANDDCAGAVALPVGTACTAPTVANNEGASASTGVADPACADYYGGDLWYAVAVPANGVLMLETSEAAGSNIYNTGLAVYTGSCGGLTALACDDNNSGTGFSYLRLSGRLAGEVLYVRVWTNYNSTGRFGLCATTDDAAPATTWTGAVSSSWFEAGNWTAGVPTATTNALVLNTGSVANWPVVSGSATAHTLSIDKYTDFNFVAGTLAVGGNLRCRNSYAQFVDMSNSPTAGGGTVELTGTAPQQVSGLDEVYDLRMHAASTATLGGTLRVYHAVTMAGGLLDTGQGWIELYNDNLFAGEFVSNARLVDESETSYVLGRIRTRRFVAPGSSEDFSGLGFTLFSHSANTPGGVQLNRYTGPAPTGVGGGAGIRRSYVADAGRDTGLDLTLDLHYFAHELNGLAEADLQPYSSALAGGDQAPAAGPWTPEAGSVRRPPVLPDSASTLRLTGLAHLSGWTLGGAAAPLPVQLVAFTAEAQHPDALLRWTTASEKNTAYFDVEASRDGRTFAAVGRVPGTGTSAQAHRYELRDAGLARYGAPVVYYRLHQVDADGRSSYSAVRPVRASGTADHPAALPNPFHSDLQVQLTAAAAGPALLVLRDALGRECLRQTTPLEAGAATVPVPGAATLPAGLYLLTITQGGRSERVRVSKE